DEARTVRAAASAGLAAHFDEARDSLLDALRTGSGPVQDAALRALDGRGPDVRGALLAWSTTQVGRAERLRSFARSLEGTGTPSAGVDPPAAGADGVAAASAAFLGDILRGREWQIEDRLLMAVSVAGAPEASGLLRRCLRSDDAETRAQAIEALDTLGDRALGRS